MVELAATRYSHLITRLFLREPVNAIVLGLLVVTTILCLLAAGTANDDAVGTTSQMGSGFTLVLVTASLLVLLPCIYFVFVTLSPISIIEWIRKDAVKVIKRVTSRKASPVQHRVLRSIEELQDISRGAITQGDRDIAMASVQALTSMIYSYSELKPNSPDEWFTVSGRVSPDPDFIALGADSLVAVEQRRTWLDNKIFRQLVGLTGLSTGGARGVANLISINTQAIATGLGLTDKRLLGLCIGAFNSSLRVTINANGPRTTS